MAADPTVVAQAREWIDRVDAGRGLSNSWRLQVIQKRYRRRDAAQDTGTALECDGESCVGLPMRIRRFVPGCPWALVDQAVRYLICKAPYEGIIYNGLTIPGKYRPTLTMWQRDEQSTVDEQKPQNGTYTLIQDLVEDDCEDEETVVTGETCSYVETTEYRWSDSSPGELPGCGSECAGTGVCQGVTYAVRSQRNEDGTFDWQLVKRVAKTQHAGPFAVECNGCTGRTTQETWDNLYGDPVRGYRDDCGNRVDVPSCDRSPGEKTQVQVQQNPDCTYRVTVTVRESLEYSDSWTDGTACRVRTVVDGHNLRRLPPDPVPKAGESVRVQVRRNDDCTWDRQVETTSAPEELRYGWTDGTGCRVRTVSVVRDAKERPAVPEVGPGETLEADVSRNQDCTWDARFSVRKAAKPDWFSWTQGSGCRLETVTSYSDWESVPPVPRPEGGRTVSASIRRNDDCTYDGQVTVREPADSTPVEYVTGTACRRTSEYSVRNAAEQPHVPYAQAGQTVQARVSRNDDCTYDATYSVTVSQEDVETWREGTPCETRDVVSYQNSRTRPEVPRLAPGQTVQASVRKNDDCTYDGQVSVTTAVPADFSWTEGAPCGPSRTTYSFLSQQTRVGIPAPKEGETVRGSVTRNRDCTWDTQYSVDTYPPRDTGMVEWESVVEDRTTRSVYLHGMRIFSHVKTLPKPTGNHNWTTYTFEQNDDCTWSGAMGYRDLDEWSDTSGGDEGGIRENDKYAVEVPFTVEEDSKSGSGQKDVKHMIRRYNMPLITFIGRGNEGTEAYWKVHGAAVLPPNCSLPARTYAKYVSVCEYEADSSPCAGGTTISPADSSPQTGAPS